MIFVRLPPRRSVPCAVLALAVNRMPAKIVRAGMAYFQARPEPLIPSLPGFGRIATPHRPQLGRTLLTSDYAN
ncbi:hypothetical protein GCM10029978_118510 [Actinoallomurus acanthiterrae]